MVIDLIFGGVKLGAVEAGFRGQIPPLIGQFRHDLAGGKACELCGIAEA